MKFTQENFNPVADNAELMLADYYSSEITPEVPDAEPVPQPTASIAYSGAKPTIKVGGSYKIFTPIFSGDSVVVTRWSISDNNGDVSADTTNYTIQRDGETLKLKVAQNYYLIGTVLTVQVYGSDGSTAEINVEVIG